MTGNEVKVNMKVGATHNNSKHLLIVSSLVIKLIYTTASKAMARILNGPEHLMRSCGKRMYAIRIASFPGSPG